jgi:aspartyl-tRNA(Asn)/glutamyl-tRNA(Gln) amidotransferase subunit C
MSVDAPLVRRIARLSRIAVPEVDIPGLQGEINAILGFVAQLDEVDVSNIEPMTSVMPMSLKMREDVISDGDKAGAVTKNAPQSEDHYFLVPKMVE